jgi:hypothetical protein
MKLSLSLSLSLYKSVLKPAVGKNFIANLSKAYIRESFLG